MIGLELYMIYGAVNFVRVMAKAYQQVSVVNGFYDRILPVSLVMGTLEVITWAIPGMVAVKSGILSWPVAGLCLVLGISGGLGAITAMKLHGVEAYERV